MTVAYITLDEVHEDRARRLSRAKGVGLEVFWPTETISRRDFPIVVYDLDFLPAERRDLVLRRALSRRTTDAVAMHGYNLTRHQRKALRQNGVLVSRRLGSKLLSRVVERATCGAGCLAEVA